MSRQGPRSSSKRATQGSHLGQAAGDILLSARTTLAQSVRQGLALDTTNSQPSPSSEAQATPRSGSKTARASVAPNLRQGLTLDSLNLQASSPSEARSTQRSASKKLSALNALKSPPNERESSSRTSSKNSAHPGSSGNARSSNSTATPAVWTSTEATTAFEETLKQKLASENRPCDEDIVQFLEHAVPSSEHRQEVILCTRSLLAAVRRASALGTVDKGVLAHVLGPVLWSVVDSQPEVHRKLSEVSAPESSVKEVGAAGQIIRFDFYNKVYQGLAMQGDLITRMTMGNTLEKKGVREKWRVLAVDSLPIKDYEELRTAVDLRRKIRNRAFKVSFEADAKTAALHAEKQKAQLWRTLQTLRQEDQIDLSTLEQHRQDVLRDRDAMLALLGQNRVHELQVLLGTATATEIEELEELLAFIGVDDFDEVRRMASGRLVTLKDREGFRAAHYVQSAQCAELILQAGPPELAREVSANGQSAATMMAARGVNIDKFLMNWDLPSLLAVDSCGMCVAMRLESEQWEEISRMLPTWDEWQKVLLPSDGIDIKQVSDGLASIHNSLHIRGLVADCESYDAVIAALHVACFGDPLVWQEGQHTERSSERLRKVGSTIVGLFGQLNDSPSAVDPLRTLMNATKGPKHNDLDPRAPWRNDLDDAVSAFERTASARLEELAKVADSEEKGWLHTVDDVMVAHGIRLRLDCQLPGCPRWDHPEWIRTCEFEASMKDLGADSIQKLLDLGLENFVIDGLESYEMSFARLDSFSRREFCQQHVSLVHDFFVRLATDNGCMLHARKSAKAINRILEKAAATVNELTALGVQPSKEELKTAGDYVTDINGVEIIASDVRSMRRVCEWCMAACWKESGAQLLRLKNTFTAPHSSGYRDIKLYMLVNINETPLVVEVQIILHSMYQLKAAMHVAYEYRRGSFDHIHLASKCTQSELTRFLRCVELSRPELCTADDMSMELLTAIDDLQLWLNNEKDALTARGVLEEQVDDVEEIASGKARLQILQSRKAARDELNSALEEGSDDLKSALKERLDESMSSELICAADRKFSAVKAHQRLVQACCNAKASGLDLCLEGFNIRCDSVSSELLTEALREVAFDLKHASSLNDFDSAVSNARLFDAYAHTDFEVQRKTFVNKAQDATAKLMPAVPDESLLRKLLQESADPNIVDDRGRTPLNLAVQQLLASSAHTLLEFKADPNITLKFGNTLLHRVLECQATSDTLQIATDLISGRADLNCTNDDGWCPLHFAARQKEGIGVGEAACLQVLLKTKKVRINAALPTTSEKLPGASPLHVAVSAGNFQAVTSLVQGKADLNALDAQKRTPLLHVPIARQDHAFAEYLLKMEANLGSQDVDGNSVLHLSAAAGAPDLVRLLLDANANSNLRNKTRQTPLRYTKEKGSKSQKEVCKLLEAGGGR